MTTPLPFTTRVGIPALGAGIGLRREFYDALPLTSRRLDWVEIIPENFITFGGRARKTLEACRERWPVISHGVGLNLGGPDPLDETYLDGLAALLDRVRAPFFSDHLCFSRVGGVQLHELLPLPFSEAAVEHVVPRIRAVAQRLGRPVLIENPSYYAKMPGGTLAEASFLRAVAEEADCGLLLDVNNVVVNAHNHGYDAHAFIEALPLERVAQLHLAGHERRRVGEEEVRIDTHGAAVPEEVWSLYRAVLARTGAVSTLIEWDQGIPSVDAVLDEADRARVLLAEAPAAPGLAAGRSP